MTKKIKKVLLNQMFKFVIYILNRRSLLSKLDIPKIFFFIKRNI